MKALLISLGVALVTAASTANAFSVGDAATVIVASQESNDPNANSRRTQAASELGGVGEEQITPVIDTPAEAYPARPGEAVIDEEYPAKAE
jgi:hypothetical protein